jgi:hypothetical protein
MSAKTDHDSLDQSAIADVTVEPSNRHVSARLKQAVRRSGGNQAVATRAGIALSTLNAYLAGRDMKLSFMVALAKVCDVNIAWLATGEGPMSGPAPSAAMPPENQQISAISERHDFATPPPLTTFGSLDVERIGKAVEAAIALVSRADRPPTAAKLGQLVLLLYDNFEFK